MVTVSLLAIGLSFLFALGGVGSAVVLVPVMHWIGYPLNEAKPTGLFVNTISLIAASYSNIRNKRIDFGIGIPIIISSMVIAPLGAYVSTLIGQRIVLTAFAAFLVFSGTMMISSKEKKVQGRPETKKNNHLLPMILIGALAGFISGLLGVGGGGVITPLMILKGYNPKVVAVITAFVVPFTSITGFLAYLTMGHFNVLLVLPVGISAYLGGYLGTHFMHLKLSPKTVKNFLAIITLLIGLKIIWNLL